MDNIHEFLETITDGGKREKFEKMIDWVQNTFPELVLEIRWKQPMFIHHGTYIIGFSVAKSHFSFSPEEAGIEVFKDEAEAIGYQTTKMLIKVKWTDDINYDFIEKVIKYNMKEKENCKTFWRGK